MLGDIFDQITVVTSHDLIPKSSDFKLVDPNRKKYNFMNYC